MKSKQTSFLEGRSYIPGIRRLFVTLFCGLAVCLSISAQTFEGTGVGAIPDSPGGPVPTYGTPLEINFDVTGINAPLTEIQVQIGMTHTFAGDLDIVLTSPNGSASIILASRIGATTDTGTGDSSNFSGVYYFTDTTLAPNIWTVATAPACGNDCEIEQDFYRTTQGGGGGQINPAPETNLTATFAGLTTNQINGDWKLTIRDGTSQDTGTVTFARLSLFGAPAIVTNTSDTNDGICDANCSLREAITSGSEQIAFSTLFDTPQIIVLTEGELIINNDVQINGPGANLLTVSGNNAGRVFNIISDFTVSLNDMTISNGTVNGDGGGVKNVGGTLRIERCQITNNTANFGGGIENASSGLITILNSTISDNSASFNGGGILNQSNGTVSIIYSTISGNTAQRGGGIHNISSQVYPINVTISNNHADVAGGGINNLANQTISPENTIIANNSAPSGPDFFGTIDVTPGNILIGNPSGTTISGNGSGIQLNVDPLLAPLANYGGTTKTHALLPGSPAIDVGFTRVPNDQRNLPRYDFPNIPNVDLGSDIGAFERQPDDFAGNRARFDLDGDGKTDIGIFRPGPGEWWYLRSSDGGNSAFQFGQTTDTMVPADFTGDGATDIAFFRPASGEWFVLRSEDSSFFAFSFGTSEDIPAPGDFDGDGKDDPAVFRPSSATWFILNSGGGVTTQPFGLNGDAPIPADYDGDGKTDIAIYRSSVAEWYYQRSTDLNVIGFQFGFPNDTTPVQADYTGDGKADIAFFRPTTNEWFVLRSEDSSFFAFPFGSSGDIPVPGDYDGDGTADPAVFRPSNQNWFLQQSTDGIEQVPFGIPNDIPIPAAYVPSN